MINPKFNDLQCLNRGPTNTFKAPIIQGGVSAPWSNRGQFYIPEFTMITKKREFRNILSSIFNEYRPEWKRIQTSLKAIYGKDPIVLARKEKVAYAEFLRKFENFATKKLKERPEWMPYVSMYGFSQQKKAKNGAQVSSSWLGDEKAWNPDSKQFSVKIGGKFLTFMADNEPTYQEYLNSHSRGHIIATIVAKHRRGEAPVYQLANGCIRGMY